MIYNEVEILRYVENDLTQKQRITFEQKMTQDEELRDLVQNMKASVLPYEAVMTEQEQDKMPHSLYKFLGDISRVVNEDRDVNDKYQKKAFFGKLALVASFAAVLFFAGFMSSSVFNASNSEQQNLLSDYDVPAKLFESMATYQELYSRKTVEAANQSINDTNALLSEFNKDNQLALSVPNLSEYGYKFRRVQQLNYDGKPILQFVYLDDAGEPVAVCVTPANTGNVKQTLQMTSSFGAMNTVFWGHEGGAYMLISKEPQKKLETMAENLLVQQAS